MHPMQDLPIYDLGEAFAAAPRKKGAWDIVEHFYEFYGAKGFKEIMAKLASKDDCIYQQ